MKWKPLTTVCCLAWSALLAGDPAKVVSVPCDTSEATQIIERYLKLPHPKEDRLGENRSARLTVLRELEAMPEDAVRSIAATLPLVNSPEQRVELLETLGRLKTEASAAVLVNALKDPDARVRGQAISSLRLMARQTNRVGGKRRVLRDNFAPAVKKLVSHLVAAANDRNEENRRRALFALADTRDLTAVGELRNRLKDPSATVRFYAASLLTEFQDASGLTELRTALDRIRTMDRDDPQRFFHAETLLASFERITGKNFGPVPMNPLLMSNLKQMREATKRYDRLLDTWSAWWAWEPKDE